MNKRTRVGLCGGSGLVLILVGLVFGLVVRNKVDSGLLEISEVCSTSDSSFDSWATNTGKDDAPKYKLYYGFNLTNPQAYLAGATPNLEMQGPYAMRQFDTKFNVSFIERGTASHLLWERFQFEQHNSCEGCTSYDRFNNLNPVFLKTLTATGSELVAGLTVSNVDPLYATRATCDPTSIATALAQPCDPDVDETCCCQLTLDPVEMAQNKSCYYRATNFYSQLAQMDNGVEVPNPIFGKTYSGLIMNKNVHEAAYGYPSAFGGVLGGLQAAAALDIDELSSMATFTNNALLACGNSASGIAPPVEDLSGPGKHLGLITCSPLQWSIGVGALCQGGALPAAMCSCVDPKFGDEGKATVTHPCCTVAGLGCLAQVPGYVSDEMFLTQDQYFSYSPNAIYVERTGCGSFEKGAEFHYEKYSNKSAIPTWATQGRDPYTPPTQPQLASIAADPSQFTFISQVRGGDGTRRKGTGRTSGFLVHHLSDGTPHTHDEGVFITQTNRTTTVHHKATQNYEGVRTLRFEVTSDFLNRGVIASPATVDNAEVGAGTPIDGVQDITFGTGFPAYVSKPLFLGGQENYTTTTLNLTAKGGEGIPITADQFDTYLLVEPASGMTISAHKRLMASFGVWSCAPTVPICNALGAKSLADMNPQVQGGVVIPQYWMDETASATSSQLKDLKKVMHLSLAADSILLVFPLAGAALLALAVSMHITSRSSTHPTRRSLLQDTDNV